MRTPEKDTLIDRCLRGNRDAQNELYQREVHGVFHLVIRLVANRMDAEDLTQECFIKVFQRLPQFRGEASVRTWIKRIAINISLEHLRRQQPILVPVDDHVLAEEAPLPQADMTRVHHAIKELPKGCRVVLTLYLLEGYRQAEIAEILAVSVSTVKSQYWRAKHLLRLALTQNTAQHE
ncbi:MAG: RNA polymerase sigma factor [Lewinella sp.]